MQERVDGEKGLAESDLASPRQGADRASEGLLRSVLQALPDGVVVVDAGGHVVMWSAGADNVLRMPRADIALHHWPKHYGIHTSDRRTLLAGSELPLVKALAGMSIDREERFLQNENVSGAWISISAQPLRAADGTITGAVGIFRDTTAERSIQEQLMVADRISSVGMLASGVAHEINNPLGAALLNLEIAQDICRRPFEQRCDSELAESLTDARSALGRVREIVLDLRLFSRHDEPTGARGEVERALESSLRMAWSEIRHRARVVKDYQPTPIISGSEARLGQVFLNLLVNAAEALAPDNVEANAIRLATRTDAEGNAVVEVSDTGSGIPPEATADLFTPFVATRTADAGTGLGLPICQRIVTDLGGRIEVESVVGEGTTFRVVLPPAVSQPDSATKTRAAATAIPARRGRILIVDHEPMLAGAIRRILAGHHDVVTTSSAADALERLRGGATFDVIFSDLMMPQVTGMELYSRIRQEFPEHASRMVFLTGGTFTQAAHDFLARVPNSTLEKPVDRSGLLALVSARVKTSTISTSTPSAR